jgi:hypothetical protein
MNLDPVFPAIRKGCLWSDFLSDTRSELFSYTSLLSCSLFMHVTSGRRSIVSFAGRHCSPPPSTWSTPNVLPITTIRPIRSLGDPEHFLFMIPRRFLFSLPCQLLLFSDHTDEHFLRHLAPRRRCYHLKLRCFSSHELIQGHRHRFLTKILNGVRFL